MTTLLFFSAFSVMLIPAFGLYGKMLIAVGRVGGATKVVGGLVIYTLFAIVLMAPFLIDSNISRELRGHVHESNLFMVYLGACYVLSMVPGVVVFKKRYLKELKRLGFFKGRGC
ncbi:hypothetical protein [Halomonas sp. C05BenzN]|uniref:hypothetical protein n=1 Tax=Halomonas sp. C05BenzN TaxID=3411041 RepID=UPI003B9465CD